MRPSISVSLEPGLERGVPWGRDLYTFVTSAAGHMMRTLQKPRKNRPSKRQVNHRRFLYNMIQRKFADMEAANHRLASAINVNEEEKNPPSQKPETLDMSGSPSRGNCSDQTDVTSNTRSNVSVGLHETEKKQQESGHLWKRHIKSQLNTCTDSKNNRSKDRQKKSSTTSSTNALDFGANLFECYSDEGQLKSANDLSDSQANQQDFIQFGQNVDISPSFSPELSPLSLDSCDFSIQMFTDASQAQRSIADLSESQWTDIMDLFSAGSKDLDVEAYFESICACQGDAGQEVGFDQSDSFSDRSEVEDLCEAGEYRYENSCHGGQTINHFQRQNEDNAESQFNFLKPTQDTDVIQNQLHYDTSELQAYQRPQQLSPCMLVNSENFTPFEGVAQSFSVPLHNPELRPIQTPPHDDDWLFPDILKDRRSPDC